jgi:hypothetical protein
VLEGRKALTGRVGNLPHGSVGTIVQESNADVHFHPILDPSPRLRSSAKSRSDIVIHRPRQNPLRNLLCRVPSERRPIYEGRSSAARGLFLGHRPGFGPILTDADIASLVSYARTRFGGATTPTSEAAVSLIRSANRGRNGYWTVNELMKEP